MRDITVDGVRSVQGITGLSTRMNGRLPSIFPRTFRSGIYVYTGIVCMGIVFLAGGLPTSPASAQSVAQSTTPIRASSTASSSAVSTAISTDLGGQETPCINGEAAGFACSQVNLLSIISPEQMGATDTCLGNPPSNRCLMSDMWGWTDPDTDREYAIVGREDGTSFIDVTDPLSPIYVGNLPHNGIQPSFWRDIKVYQNYAFIVADGLAGNGMQIFDLAVLRDFGGTPTTFQMSGLFDGIGSAHNIVINEDTGFAYITGASGISCQGLYILDLSEPLNPVFAGCFMASAPNSSYTHDAQCVMYHGPDTAYTGHEICMMSNGDAVVIADVTDKSSVQMISSVAHPSAVFIHQGWLTEDQNYFVQDDEEDELQNVDVTHTRTIIWDVTNLDDPVLETVYDATGTSIDHNLYVKGRYVFQSNYTDGLHILDISDPVDPVEAGFFDTYQPNPGSVGFEVWNGTWSNYPYFRSGAIAVSSSEEGLFMVRPSFSTSVATEAEPRSVDDVLIETYPNPAKTNLRVAYRGPSTEQIRVVLFDVLGREIKVLAPQIVLANTRNEFHIDLSDLPAGAYFVKVSSERFAFTKPVDHVR